MKLIFSSLFLTAMATCASISTKLSHNDDSYYEDTTDVLLAKMLIGAEVYNLSEEEAGETASELFDLYDENSNGYFCEHELTNFFSNEYPQIAHPENVANWLL